MRRIGTSLFVCTAALFGALVANAVSGSEGATPQAANSLSDSQIEQLIKDLDGDSFEIRRRATKQLDEAGARVFDALVRAAQQGSLETRMHCFRILEKAFRTDDSTGREAAKKALERLAKSELRNVASRAKAILTEPEAADTPMLPGGPNVNQRRLRITGKAGEQVVVSAGAVGGAGPVQIRIQIDDEEFIDVIEDRKRIQIRKDPDGSIEMSVTERKNGQPKTKLYQAKNADELKKKHPDVYTFFRKHHKDVFHNRRQAQPK